MEGWKLRRKGERQMIKGKAQTETERTQMKGKFASTDLGL